MIADLVRNDLSRISKKNTVNVDELMGLYTYEDVHHLISTISCEISHDKNIVDILKKPQSLINFIFDQSDPGV